MAQREPVMRQPGKPRKKAKPLKAPERSGFFPVVTSNVLNMICVTTVVATVLAVLLGVAKWTWRSKTAELRCQKDSAWRWRLMLQNAQYSVWFRTSEGEGYGVILLLDGNVSGGNTISSYTGTYVQDGDRFAATIAVKRHTQGPPSAFGIDNVDITVSGKLTPTTASCFGTAN
jgi:hypothetical protein